MINHTYDIAEESGSWYVVIDGEIVRNATYRTSKAARTITEKLATANTMWNGVFAIESQIAEALKDKPWPYGATCVNHGTDTDPSWVLNEPYRIDDEATRTVHPDPTGYVQINVYTRHLYEAACQAAGIEPATDDTIKDDLCDCGHQYISDDNGPTEVVKARLAYRRATGIQVEQLHEQKERAERLEEAGLLLDKYTRDQYTAACEIMGVLPIDDGKIMLVVTLDIARAIGIEFISPDLPDDPITRSLAYRRAVGIKNDNDSQNAGANHPDDDNK